MRYWKQIDFFGIGNTEKTWMTSLLERMSELSCENIDDLRYDGRKKDMLRIHEIDWSSKSIPISREKLSWIDPVYRDNPAEYPLIQIHISKALGRIVGFWDDASVFQIVLLDPLHNLQPSSSFDYRVRNTAIQRCHYSQLLAEIERVKRRTCESADCQFSKALESVPGKTHEHVVSIIRFSDDAYADALAALDLTESDHLSNLIEAGIDMLQSRRK